MLSKPMHRFSLYHVLPSSTAPSNGHISRSHRHAAGLEGLSQGPKVTLQDIQDLQLPVETHNQHLAQGSPRRKQGPRPYSGGIASINGPIRRRISRACDQCNQLRTKCDGRNPCAHCIGMFEAPRKKHSTIVKCGLIPCVFRVSS